MTLEYFLKRIAQFFVIAFLAASINFFFPRMTGQDPIQQKLAQIQMQGGGSGGESVKGLIENAVQTYIKNKQTSQFNNLSDEEKEDIGLMMLMQEADRNDKVSEEEIFKILGR